MALHQSIIKKIKGQKINNNIKIESRDGKGNKTAPGRFLKCKLRAGTLRIPILYRPSIIQRGSSGIVQLVGLRSPRF